MNDKFSDSVLDVDVDERGAQLNCLPGNKELHAELKEQQEFYRTSFEQAVTGLAKVALDGRFVLVNPCWLNFIGYSHEEMLNLTFQAITHPADLQHSLDCMDQLINGEKDACHHEKRFFHKNGQVLWGRLSMTIQRDAVGLPRYFIGTLQDMTETKTSRDKIAGSYEHYCNLLDTTGDGFLLVNEIGQIKDVNRAFIQQTGYRREELLTMSLGDLVAVETKEQTREHFDKIIEQKYDVFETQYRAKNGRLLDLEVRGTYLEGMGDFVIFLSDIGERKKMLAQEKTALIEAEASLQRAIKAEKQQLQAYEETRRHLGRELHDNIGQQITAVALLSDILAKDLIKEVNPLYESAKKITTRLNHALSRIRQLSHGFYQNTFDHDSLIDRLKSLASETTSIHGIGCTFHYDKTSRVKDYFGYGDTPAEECHLQLFRIAQEAVTNAVRHSGASQIELSLRHSSKGDILSITDNGIGISTKNHSSGLGMYSMAFRAKLMKADIVFNTLKTGGTCVSICMARDRKRY